MSKILLVSCESKVRHSQVTKAVKYYISPVPYSYKRSIDRIDVNSNRAVLNTEIIA